MNRTAKRVTVILAQLFSAALLVALDQIFKALASQHLQDGSITLIENILELRYTENTGAAFSSFSGATTALIVVTVVLLAVLIVALVAGKIKGRLLNVCAVMILAGGVGNLIDRIACGYVTDYIHVLFIDFPVFNFADILVTCGVFIALGRIIYDMVVEAKSEKKNE